MTSDPTPRTYRSDKPCGQPICRHRRSEHLDGGAMGKDHHCRLCKCSAYVSARAWSGGECSGRSSGSMSTGPPNPPHRRGSDTAPVGSEDGWLVSEGGG